MLLWEVTSLYIYIKKITLMERLIRSSSALLGLMIYFIIQTEFKNNIPIVLNQQRTINFLVGFFPICSYCLCIGYSVSICQPSKYGIKYMSGRQEHLPVPCCFYLSTSQLMFTAFDHKLVCFVLLSHRKLPYSSILSLYHNTVHSDPWQWLGGRLSTFECVELI